MTAAGTCSLFDPMTSRIARMATAMTAIVGQFLLNTDGSYSLSP
jgi:hypothetical protein